MADVLGVAASVAGLMTIADVIVRKGFKFIQDVKNADESVEKLVEEVNNLSGVLHSLNNVVEQLEQDGRNTEPTTRTHHIESCYKTLKKIMDLFDEAVLVAPLSKVEKLKWPLKKAHTKELLTEIERHKATMILAMSARGMTTLLQILARQDDIRCGIQGIKLSLEAEQAERQKVAISEKRREMLKLLGDIDARKWQDSNIRLRQPGTGVWFTDGAEFKTWLSTDESKLWINGIPGAGKTILMSSVIQEIGKRVESSHALAFFYCDYKDPQTQQPLNILGALAKQLILQDERCFAQLNKFSILHTEHIIASPTPEDLCELIRKLSKCFETTMIIIDGLDEITNDRAGVTRLLSSLNTQGGQIKTLFASRPEVDIGYELEDFVQVSIAAMSSDLRLYVASEIERRTRERKMRIRDPSLKEHIMATLVDKADGMFRWVACQMDYLCECNNDRDRREALKKLPPDLPSSYERILERVNRSSKENQQMVRKTIHWITYAGRYYKGFNNEQLIQALAVRDEERFFDSSAMTTEEDILHWCSSLVRRNRWSGKLELAHFTVEEFLKAIDPVKTPYFQQYRLSGDHTLLASACLRFILCQEFDGHIRPKIQYNDNNVPEIWAEFTSKYSFMSYSCWCWSYHVHNSTWADIEKDVLALFSEDLTFSFWTRGWIEHEASESEIEPYSDLEEHSPPTPLHWAALFALEKLCAMFIEEGMDVSQSSIMGTPLYCAMVAEYALYPFSVIEDSKEFSPDPLVWQYSARRKVFHQLLEAEAILDAPIDATGQKRALTIAIWIESNFDYNYDYDYAPFMVSTLLDADARFSGEDLAYLRREFGMTEGDWELEDPSFVGISILQLIKAVAKEIQKALIPVSEAEFEFFSLILDIVSRGCPPELLQPLFELEFSHIIPGINGSELNSILSNELEDPKSRLVLVLSKAIRYTSPSTEKFHLTLRDLICTAIRYSQAAVLSLLLDHNSDIDANQQLNDGGTLLHRALGPFSSADHEVIESLIHHGASVVHPDKNGVTPMEFAGITCSLNTFQLLWDSAVSTIAFEKSPKALEKIFSSVLKDSNEPITRFLSEKLCEGTFIPNTSLLEFAARQETSTLLETLFDLQDKLGLCSTERRDFEVEEEEEEGENVESNTQDGEDELIAVEIGKEGTNCTNQELETFCLAAKPEGSVFNFTFLLQRGVSTSHQYYNGNTILHHLAMNQDDKSFTKLQVLLEWWRPKLDVLNDDSFTPLALTIRNRNLRAMEMLLEAGSNLDILLAGKNTALHIASYLGNTVAVQALLKKGCQTAPKNDEGQTPKDSALACEHHEIAAHIQETINAQLAISENHPIPSNIEQLSSITVSSFPRAKDHDDLPIRIAHVESISNASAGQSACTSNHLMNMEAGEIATLSRKNTASPPINTLENSAPTSPNQQNIGTDVSQHQVLTEEEEELFTRCKA